MPARLSYDTVRDYIHEKGYVLISKEYEKSKQLLEIKCNKCNKIYSNTFKKFKEGHYHPNCENEDKLPYIRYITPRTILPVICAVCKKEFQPKYSNKLMCSRECYRNSIKPRRLLPVACIICNKNFQPRSSKKRYCSKECSNSVRDTDEYKQRQRNSGKEGGKRSAANQPRRSKNEIYFSELCSAYFTITTNEPFFDGWDADVIIHSEKIAVLWNGVWHYKQISKSQSLLQVQTREKIKFDTIEKAGYIPYIIKDMGKYNRNFVEQEFEIFMMMRMSLRMVE